MAAHQEITKVLIERYKDIADNERSFDHQWEHCFRYFSSKPKDHDLGCLHLSFYLASWGMYRGSAGVRNFDHLVHHPIVEEVLLPRYDSLRGASLDGLLVALDLIWELAKKIRALYPSSITVTDTLLTKILMGTLGCTPAYDRYFRAGVATDGISQTFSRNGFYSLLLHCQARSEGFIEAQNQIPRYPVMRLVDMYYFAVGERLKSDLNDRLADRK
jgi:hypothetical protein